jgi:hypothetical protein
VAGDPARRVPLHPALRFLFGGEGEVRALRARPVDGDPAPALPQIGKREGDFIFLHELPRMILFPGHIGRGPHLAAVPALVFGGIARSGGGRSLGEPVSGVNPCFAGKIQGIKRTFGPRAWLILRILRYLQLKSLTE